MVIVRCLLSFGERFKRLSISISYPFGLFRICVPRENTSNRIQLHKEQNGHHGLRRLFMKGSCRLNVVSRKIYRQYSDVFWIDHLAIETLSSCITWEIVRLRSSGFLTVFLFDNLLLIRLNERPLLMAWRNSFSQCVPAILMVLVYLAYHHQ